MTPPAGTSESSVVLVTAAMAAMPPTLLVLDTTGKEGEDFVLYARSYTPVASSTTGATSASGERNGGDRRERRRAERGEIREFHDGASSLKAVECPAVLVDCAGMLLASNDAMKSLVGQPVRTLVFGGDGEHGGAQRAHASYADAGSTVFVLVMPVSEPLGRCFALARETFDLLVTLLGPVTPKLRRWGTSDIEIRDVLDPIMTVWLSRHMNGDAIPAISGAMGPADVLGSGASAFEPSPELFCALEETLCEAEAAGTDSDAHLSTDGIRLVLPVGAALLHRGSVVLSHLGTHDLEDCLRLLRLAGILERGPEAKTVEYARHVSLPVSPDGSRFRAFDACARGSWAEPAAIPRMQHADASDFPDATPNLSFTEDRVLIAVAQQDSVLLMLLSLRDRRTGEVDPFLVDAIRAALHLLRTSGALQEIDAQMDACVAAPLAPSATPPSCRTTVGDEHSEGGDSARDAIVPTRHASDIVRPTLTAGGDNVLLQYISFSGASGLVLHPIPKYVDGEWPQIAAVAAAAAAAGSATSEGDDDSAGTLLPSWTALINEHFRRAVPRLRSVLRSMRLGDVSEAVPPSEASGRGAGSLHVEAASTTRDAVNAHPDGFDPLSSSSESDSEAEAGAAGSLCHGMTARALFRQRHRKVQPIKANHGQELGLGTAETFEYHPERAAEAVPEALEAGSRFEVDVPGLGRLQYWVVGRLLPPDREFYVCYDASGSVTQDAVEMAFRLTFGTT